MYGPLIIEPQDPEPFRYDREHVVMLTDWTDEKPERVFAKLKKQSDYYNFHRRTVGDFFRDVGELGFGRTVADRKTWGEMRMNPTDLADVSGYTYTYLMNGAAPAVNWTGVFRSGERIRLRLINGSAMTYFDVRIPGLKMTVVAMDGQYVHPVTVDEFRMAVAETVDVIVEPSGQDAFTIFAQSMDRTGYARGTLATREGLGAPVPDLDPHALLTMADMGHGGMGHDMAAMGGAPAGVSPVDAKAPSSGSPRPEDPHAGHTMAAPAPTTPDAHAGHNMPARPPATPDPHAGHDMSAMGGSMQTHPASEEGNPLVDMQTMSPTSRLDDPGIGLRDNGRRVMWSDLEDNAGQFLVRKHTIDMPPGTKRSYRVTADALGRWAYHCHLLFHMESGMFREVRVDE